MIKFFKLLKEQNEFNDPHDQLSRTIQQVLGGSVVQDDLLDEELYYIQAAAGRPDFMMPEQDKDR